MELKGSKTEKNLQEAFAGESQARKKLLQMKKNMQKFGLNFCTAEAFLQQLKTLKMLHAAKTMNGLKCMHSLLKKQKKKVLMK